MPDDPSKFYLLTADEQQFGVFKDTISNIVGKDAFVSSNKDLQLNECGYWECDITKTSNPNWFSTCLFPTNTNRLDTKHLRIFIYKCATTEYYVEINGQLGIVLDGRCGKIMKLDKASVYIPKNKEHDELTKFRNSIYFGLMKRDLDNELREFNLSDEARTRMMSIDFSKNNIELLYDEIPMLPDSDKLIPYVRTDCMRGENASSETEYNKRVCEANPTKYQLLDTRRVLGCEIADIYDKDKNYLFHNKKNNDLRVLGAQVAIASSLLKTTTLCDDYIRKHKLDTTNITYVFGLINTKKTGLALKDKMALGMAHMCLRELGIQCFIDEIRYVE